MGTKYGISENLVTSNPQADSPFSALQGKTIKPEHIVQLLWKTGTTQ
jgi:hypothetical protein